MLMKHEFSGDNTENSLNISLPCLERWDRQGEGRVLLNEFQNIGTPLKMLYIFTEVLRDIWPSYRQLRRYIISVCQVNTGTYAVHLLTRMI